MTSTTKNTIPAAGASFLTDLQNFLREEDADRFRDHFTGMIVSGGTHVTGAGLSHTPDSLTAYPGGHYITETGAITYPDSTTHLWVICHRDTTTAITDWTRQSGTHYLFRNTGSGSTPTLPVVESAILMKITTASGAVSAVQDGRVLRPWAPLHFDFDNSRAGVATAQALVTDGLFHVSSATAGSITANASADEVVLEGSGDSGLTVLSGNTSTGGIFFGDDGANNRGRIEYLHTGDRMLFSVGATNVLDLDDGTGAIFNDGGAAAFDFRVEGDTSTHLIFADASANRAGISLSGNLVTDGLFHIASATAGSVTANADGDELVIEGSGNTGLTVFSGNTSNGVLFFADDGSNNRASVDYDHNTDVMEFFVAGGANPTCTFGAAGAIFNEGSAAALDLRVESDANTHMLFVDAGNNSVHIDNSLLTGAGDGDLVMANAKVLRWINNAGTSSSNFGINGTSSDDMSFDIPSSDQFIFRWATNVRIRFDETNSGGGILFEGESSSDHGAPASNGCVIFTTDTGGKTQLMARFATGAVQQIAVQP